jgi:16S rRNA (cytidine1402-2'-O)-methyltransferase
MAGRLFIVALPIGNLSDITQRALETLRSVDFILAEDTRTTRQLLSHFGVSTPFYSSYYQGVETERASEIVGLLHQGKDLALVSDAGTPLISDPGFPLVRRVVEEGFEIHPVPGAVALIAALVGSGFPTDRFCFEGALPRRRGPRRELFSALRTEPRTILAYESPHRLLESLELLAEALPDRRIVLARELTKIHEEYIRGTAAEVASALVERGGVRGECVLVIDGASMPAESLAASRVASLVAALREEGLTNAAIQRVLTGGLGLPRNRAYAAAHPTAQRD